MATFAHKATNLIFNYDPDFTLGTTRCICQQSAFTLKDIRGHFLREEQKSSFHCSSYETSFRYVALQALRFTLA